MGFSRQEYWSGLPFPPPGDLPNPGMEPRFSTLADRFFTIWATREAQPPRKQKINHKKRIHSAKKKKIWKFWHESLKISFSYKCPWWCEVTPWPQPSYLNSLSSATSKKTGREVITWKLSHKQVTKVRCPGRCCGENFAAQSEFCDGQLMLVPWEQLRNADLPRAPPPDLLDSASLRTSSAGRSVGQRGVDILGKSTWLCSIEDQPLGILSIALFSELTAPVPCEVMISVLGWLLSYRGLGKHGCPERLRAGGEGDDRGWDGWMALPMWWTWVRANSGRWWRTGKPGVLQSMGLQRVIGDLGAQHQTTRQCMG